MGPSWFAYNLEPFQLAPTGPVGTSFLVDFFLPSLLEACTDTREKRTKRARRMRASGAVAHFICTWPYTELCLVLYEPLSHKAENRKRAGKSLQFASSRNE